MPHPANIPAATYVDHPRKLDAMVDALQHESLLAIDTESNSLHAYHERVCLIQISSRSADYIVDPLALPKLNALGTLFADPRIEKVFHASEYDLMCLKRDYQFTFSSLFDTMIAARICGLRQVGLNHLVHDYLGIDLDKSHQRDNWGRRPLPHSSLRYAQFDTHYLPELHDQLLAELEARGHLEEARETFDDMGRMTPPHEGRSFDPDGYWRIGYPARLTPRQMAVLRELYLAREALAERANIPPMNVVQNRTLVELAREQPTNRDALRGIFGLSNHGVRRWGDALLAAIARGKHAETPSAPAITQTPPDIADRYTALHAWRKKRAEERGVESDVIVTKQTLWSLAYRTPATLEDLDDIEGLGPWRTRTYGPEILSVIAKHENGAKS
ncbi:MAG: putative ribonuclease D [Chloroflexi bacterium OLB13]|nr:MAG: putative ribonuclease D [Chloroflexi bacterium OLB13]